MVIAFIGHPALDKTAVIPGYAIGRTYRVNDVLRLAGGKGFNFARALLRLGGQPLVVGPLAGHTGRLVQSLAEAEGIAVAPAWIAGETRTCMTVVDPGTGAITEVYENGPRLTDPADWERLLAELRRALRAEGARALAVSGGFQPGAPASALREVMTCAAEAGLPVWLDTYGPQLANALDLRPELIKINQHEAGDLAGMEVEGPDDAVRAAADLRRRGARHVVITLGKLGAAGRDRDGRAFALEAPDTGGLFPIGSGDSFFGGMAWALERGQPLIEAARLGVATGAANTLQPGTAIFTRDQVDALLAQVRG
jgi:1-phosphofructokinase family hexose kinase